MESVYTRFSLYDFEKDSNFKSGLKSIHIIDENEENVLKVKIFFYNRFVEAIDLDGYRRWLASGEPSRIQASGDDVVPAVHELEGKCCKLKIRSDESDSDSLKRSSSSETERPGTVTDLRRQTDGCSATTDCSSTPEPGSCASLSFAEVFRRIQAGEEVPGLQKLDVRPCNQPPTASQMTRRQKPWEKVTSQNLQIPVDQN